MDVETLEEIVKTRDLREGSKVWKVFFEQGFLDRYIKFVHTFTITSASSKDIKEKMIDGDSTVLDLVHPNHEALVVMQYVGNHGKWTEMHEHRDDPTHPSQKNRNRPGKFGKEGGVGRFTSGFNKEGMDLFESAARFFAAVRLHPYYDRLLRHNCKVLFKNTAAYKTAEARRENGSKKSSTSADSDDEGNNIVVPTFKRLALAIYGPGEDDGEDGVEEHNGDLGGSGDSESGSEDEVEGGAEEQGIDEEQSGEEEQSDNETKIGDEEEGGDEEQGREEV